MTWQTVQQLSKEGRQLYTQGALREALSKFEEALSIARQIGHRRGEGQILANMGAACEGLGRLEEALEHLGWALAIFREIGDRRGEGATLNNLGTVYNALERPQETLEHYQQALTIARQTGDRRLVEATLRGLGVFHKRMEQPQEALTYYQQVLDMRRDAGDRRGVGETLNHLATLRHDQAQLQEALACYQQALAIHREVGNHHGEAKSLHGLGCVYDHLGRPQEALECYQQALAIRRDADDRQGQGATLNNLGMVYHQLGRFQDALDHYEQALSIARELGNRDDEGGTLHGFAYVYQTMGQLREAVDYYRHSLAIAQEVGDRRGEGRTLANLGVAYEELGQLQEALQCFHEALDVQTEMRDDIAAGGTHNGLGAIYQAMGRPQEALAHYERALAICREVGDREGEGTTLHNLGVFYKALGHTRQSLECYKQALNLLREVGNRRGTILILHSTSKLDHALGQPHQALERLEQAIEIVESLRGEIASEELRTSYFGTVGDLYADYVSLLVEQGQPDGALHAAERGKARTFLELLTEAQAEIREGVEPKLWEEEQRLLQELGALRPHLIEERSRLEAKRDTALIEQLKRQEQELEQAYHANQAEIRRRNPRYAALTQPQAWGLAQIQEELLDQHTALLEYVLGKEASLLFVVLQDHFQVFLLPPRGEIETKVRELRAAVTWKMHHYPHGHELYQALIQPAEDLIQDKDLLIVADGALHYLPFALLLTEPPEEGSAEGRPPAEPTRTPQRGADDEERELLEALEVVLAPLPPSFDFPNLPYLLLRHALSYAPSATVAGMLRQEVREREEQPPHYDGQLAAFADPLTEELEAAEERGTSGEEAPATLRAALTHIRVSLPRIPLTADEVWALAGLLSEGVLQQERPETFQDDQVRLYTGAAATKEAVIALTSGEHAYRFFHIASHGLLDAERPQFSGLVFTPGERRDPYWQTFEVFNARIPSELVVLSACKTGLGRLVRGEGIVGLTRAFMYAGALAVCVSLWKVADDSTPSLMETFYEAVLAGEPKARALQRAQLRLLEEGTFVHPLYWAPFVLVGERQ